MAQIKINGLDQGRKYYVKARVRTDALSQSDWSLPYAFTTPEDTVAPNKVDDLTFVSEGDSFIAKWGAPQYNEDGSKCGDISHYKLSLKDLDRGFVRSMKSVETSYTLDFNANSELFGSPAGYMEITVSVVDLSGNESEAVTVSAQNPPPAQVQNVTANVAVESIALNWDLNTETDLSHYEVHVSTAGSEFDPGEATFRAKVSGTTSSFTYATSSIVPVHLRLVAVDKFNQKSVPSIAVSARPKLTTDFDKTPPGQVKGLTVTQILSTDSTHSIARISYTSLTDDDLDTYDVQYRKTGDNSVPWSFANVPSDQNTAEIKPLPLNTSYDFKVRAVDFNANKGPWSSVVVAPGVKKTTLPAAPTGVSVSGGMSNLMITWNASTDASMSSWAGVYEVQISKAANFTSPTTVKTASTLASFTNLSQNTVYYARVRSIDPYANTGGWSATANGNTGIVADANASKIIWSDTAPASGKTNDLWIKTPENVQYRYNGTTWVKAQDTELATAVDNVRQTADGKNKAWYQPTKPPLTNNTKGDLWFDTANGNKMHVWNGDWVSAQDQAIQDALDDASEAMTTADGKNKIYFSTPPAQGVKEGDTWFDNAVIKQYRNGAWVNASDNLDTSKARQAIQIAGSKNKTYYVGKDAATGMIEGDILFDSTDGNKQYRYSGTAWVSTKDASITAAEQAANQAQQTADKKNTIYYQTPPSTGLKNGDTWFDGPKIKTYRDGVWTDSSTNLTTQQGADAIQVAGSKNKTYYTTYASRPTTGLVVGDLLFDTADKYKQYRWTGSAWASVQDGSIKDADDKAAAAKAEADKKAQTFYGPTAPGATGLRTNDLWIKSTDNSLNRWTGSKWEVTQDSAIALTQSNLTTAIGQLQGSISDVNDKADGKVDSFITNTSPSGMTEGDIWFDTSVSPISVKVYRSGTWEVSGDKAALDAAQAVQNNLNATNANVNKKNTTYAQTTAPTVGLVAGDLWLNTTLVSGVPKNEMNRWDGSKWVKTQDKSIFDAQALADGKAKVFTRNSQPTDAESELGDIWFDVRTTPWEVRVRNGSNTWILSGDPAARTAAQNAQTEAARKIQSFYTDTDPATVPANNVKTGDLWYKTTDKRARVRAANNTWVELKDADIKIADDKAVAAQNSANTAITNASNAFNLADGKAQVFWGGNRPTNLVAADDGDIWVNTAKTPNEIQVWSGTAWSVTGDPATKAIADAANTLAGTKSYVYTQTTTPTSPAPSRGDTWIHTTTGETKIYSGSKWVAMTDPEAQNIAKSKITTYYNATAPAVPTGGHTLGDLWVKTPDNRLHRWDGTWVELKDADIKRADDKAIAAQGTANELKNTIIPNLATQVDNKIEVTVGPDKPNITDAVKQKGDIWINPATGLVQVYTGTGQVWEEVKDPGARSAAQSAANLAGTKSQVFGGTTKPVQNTTNNIMVGDLWLNETDKRFWKWNGSTWVEFKDKAISDVETTANTIVNSTLPALQTQVDKKVEVWSQATQPTGLDAVKNKGDIWINTSTGANKGEVKVFDGTTWNTSADPAAKALANTAQNTANSKRQVFSGENAPTGGTYADNDLWVQDSTQRIHIRKGNAWTPVKDVAIAEAKSAADAAAALANNIKNVTVAGLQGQLDQKIEVHIQATAPTYADADAKLKAKGDIWINNAGAKKGEIQVYNGSIWEVTTDPGARDLANAAQNTADSKRQVFGGETKPPGSNYATNDLWIRDSDKKMHRWGGINWEDAQDTAIEDGRLKGNNLIPNGHGELGSNKYFLQFAYDASDAPTGSAGSFVMSQANHSYRPMHSSLIPVNPMGNYTLSIWAKSKSEVQDRAYFLLEPVDAYGLTIMPQHYLYRTGSTTKLTADLKPGDMFIEVESTQNWFTGTHTNYGVIFWDYVDPGGKAWPKETYSRNYIGSTTYDANVPSLPATRIPLKTAYDGPVKTAGTWLSSGLSGGNYMYHCLVNTILPQEWTFYKSGIIGGVHTNNEVNARNKFPAMTAFVRVGFLTRYQNNPGSIQAFSGMDFSDVNAAQDMATSAMDSANARNRSVFSTGNATGTSLNGYSFINGDMWYKKDANNTIIGMWEFVGGAWVSKTLNNQVIANLDAGKITSGYINADRIKAGTIDARKLTIGRGSNIINDPNFLTPIGSAWTPDSSMTIVGEGSNGQNCLKINLANRQQATYNNPQGVRIEAGASFRVLMTVKSDVPVPVNSLGVGFRLTSASGANTFPTSYYLPAQATLSTYKTFDLGIRTIESEGNLSVYIMAQSTLPSGTIWIDNISVERVVGETLIEDGAIITEKIAAEAVTASEILAGTITAHQIKSKTIGTEQIIVGGLKGSVVIEDGTITATQIAGQTITGNEIKGNTIDAGHIKAGSITIGAPNSPLNPAGIATPSDVSTAKSQAISTAAGDATTKANTAKSDAIAAAAITAQTKANTAKEAAELAAKQYADGQITDVELRAKNTAATDAQTKANAAKDAAIAAAGTQADTKIGAAVGPINTKIGGWSHPTNQTFIDGGKIYTDSITAGQIAANAITVSELAANAVTAAKIKSDEIETRHIKTGQITTEKIVAAGLNGSTVITDGTITTAKIGAEQITGGKIAANTITVGNMGPNSVDRTVIKNGEITTDKIGVNQVKAGNIDAGAITAGKIAAGAIIVGGSNSPVDPNSMESAILQSRTKDYGFAYKTTITLYGEHNKYYPVGITDGDQSIDRQIMIRRSYGELHPPEWASPTHGGGLYLLSTVNFGGWGGVEYKQKIDQLQQQYNDTLADIRLMPTGTGVFYYLRGGGTTGAVYHIYSDQPVAGPTARLYDLVTGEKLNSPVIFYEPKQFYVNATTYTYTSPTPMTAPDSVRIKELSYVESAKDAFKLTNNWVFTGTTTIDGGKIKADTITAAQIAAGSITIGAPGSPLNPTGITTDAKLGQAVNPINTTLDNWGADGGRTYINGGNIKTGSITVGQLGPNAVDNTVIKDGTIITKNISANAITATEIASNAVTAAKIKANEITGDKLAVNAAIVNNLKIQSSIEINAAGGHIKSTNYVENGTTGFYMDQQQLKINQGRIKAAAIELQDSNNLMPARFASFDSRLAAYQGTNLWTSGISTVTKKSGEGVFGGDALELNATAAGYVMLGESNKSNIAIEGGQQYIVSFYVSNRANKVFTLTPGLYDTASVYVYGTAQSIANTTAWRRYSAVVTAPAAMNKALFRINPSTSALFRIDGVQVERKISQSNEPSNWSPPGFTSIDGESITTGQISSSAPSVYGDGNQPAWSINTQGNAQFSDALIKGKLVVGGYGNTNDANTSIQSHDYSAGSAGWVIKGNGDVEFNDGKFRGTLSLERAGSIEIPLKMTASVSSIKLYTDQNIFKNIDVGSIRGITYAYDRSLVAGQGDRYEPSAPNLNKIGRYFIGPTTDRSLNIQVHDGEDGAVFLDKQRENVALTSLNIGEITSPASKPSFRERQGFSYTTSKYERDPRNPERENAVVANQVSSVRLSSPFYPEQNDDTQYPDSSHSFESSIVYKASEDKNLLASYEAIPEGAIGSSAVAGSNDYSSAYVLMHPVSRSMSIDLISTNQNLKPGKQYVLSAHIDATSRDADLGIYAFRGSQPLNPLGETPVLAGDTQLLFSDPIDSIPGYFYSFRGLNNNQSPIPSSGSKTTALVLDSGSYYYMHNSIQTSAARFSQQMNYNIDNGLSVAMWAHFSTGAPSGAKVLFHRAAADYKNEIWLSLDGALGRVSGGFIANNKTVVWETDNNVMPANQWSHVSLVVPPSTSGTSYAYLYINGEKVQRIKVGSSFYPYITLSTFSPTFGSVPNYIANNRQSNQAFEGYLADVFINESYLSAAQVQSLYYKGLPSELAGGRTVTASKGVKIEAAVTKQRVAFEFTANSADRTPMTMQFVGNVNQKTLVYKLQLEELTYKTDPSTPQEIKNITMPTPWASNGVESESSVRLSLNATPALDYMTWARSLRPWSADPNADVEKTRYAEMNLDLSSQIIDPGVVGDDAQYSSARYSWSTAGMTFPGSIQPFTPAAAHIEWNYSSLNDSAKPQLTNTNRTVTINSHVSSNGAINTGDGRKVIDNFNRSNEDPLKHPWVRVGTPEFPLKDGAIKYATNESLTARPQNYVYHSKPLSHINQEVSVTTRGYTPVFITFYSNTVLMLNIDPRTKSYLAVRFHRDKIYVYSVINNILVYTTTVTSAFDISTKSVKLKLERDGNSVYGYVDGTRRLNVTVPNLPTGKHVGFVNDSGAMDEFRANDKLPAANALGKLREGCVNVNTDRGFDIQNNGIVRVITPGFYNVYAYIEANMGGNAARRYWITIENYAGGYGDIYPLTGQESSSSAINFVAGSAVAYLSGEITLKIHHDVNATSRIEMVRWLLVRVA